MGGKFSFKARLGSEESGRKKNYKKIVLKMERQEATKKCSPEKRTKKTEKDK